MTSYKLRQATVDLETARGELAKLTNSANIPFAPADFIQRYIADLRRRIAMLEAELALHHGSEQQALG